MQPGDAYRAYGGLYCEMRGMEVRMRMESALKRYYGTMKGKRVAVIGLGVSNRPLVERRWSAGA